MTSQPGLYIQIFSVHGLIRGTSPEMGRDADTGGQVKYVLELARALGKHPRVGQVDLVTRLIEDKNVSPEYSLPMEPLSEKSRIIRLQCGGRRYIRKELLWPHLDELVDKNLIFIKNHGRIPDIFHGHYADGGYVARELASIFGVPLIFTGHSMGRHKKNKLLASGVSEEETTRRYRIDHRIKVEERVIKEAEQIITSTHHEVSEQYGLYDNFSSGRFTVIPPGIDINTFFPYYEPHSNPEIHELYRQAHMALLDELHRFWVEPQKPFILALCRPDQRKNISGLITAYGEDKELQAIANLAIFAGLRRKISQKEENEREVLTEMLLLMDQYDLYGRLAIPKRHDFTFEVPELYRLCAAGHGVFVNPALVEPFGLTLIEAAACGLPIIATCEGGPTDIIGNCENGILVDPTDHREIATAIKKILVDRETWKRFSGKGINGVRRHYSWSSHCDQTLKIIDTALEETPAAKASDMSVFRSLGHRLTSLKKLIISDIDNTLVGNDQALRELLDLLAANQARIGLGLSTGRCLQLTIDVLKEHAIDPPDILICSVGTEIYYGKKKTMDRGWQQHLSHKWRPEQIREKLTGLDFLELQEPETQRQFKISYYMEDDPDLLTRVHQALRSDRLRYQLIFSHGQFLDILPYRASKGRAVRYLSYKWGIPLQDIMVCGDSGNDEDMLRGDTCGVVVANHSRELSHLKGRRNIFFSKKEYAEAIIDGIRRYGFIEEE